MTGQGPLDNERERVEQPNDVAEPEMEYGVRHVEVDGWSRIRAHRDKAGAERDFATCGMNCALVGRTVGPWVPVGEGEQ